MDEMTITVGPYSRCTSPVVRESKAQVALFLKDVCGAPDPNIHVAAMTPVYASNVRLLRPLGDRRLVDGATGNAIAWLSSRVVLRLTRASYHRTIIEPAGYGTGAQGVSAGVTQYYALAGYTHGLAIVQTAGSVPLPGPAPGGWVPIRVRGHPGRATRNLITWREDGLTDYIAVAYAVETENMDYPQVLTTRQLIALADSATSYGPGPLPVPACCTP